MPSEPTLPAALSSGHVAVVTGGASGIGLAAAKKLATLGMKIVIADLAGEKLTTAETELKPLAKGGLLAVAVDVSKAEDLVRLADRTHEKFGAVSLLMNNAGIGNNPGQPWENLDA